MPHRATYIFPRQFPDRKFDDESSQQLIDHEKKKILESIKSGKFISECNSDDKKKPPSLSSPTTATTTPSIIKNDDDIDDNVYLPSKLSALSDLFTGGGGKPRTKHKQLISHHISNWSTHHKKVGKSSHVKAFSHSHHRLSTEEERELLLPPETSPTVNNSAVDQSFDRQVSLPRLSSNGSLFSGTTLDGNFSSDIVMEETTSSSIFGSSRKQEEDEKESKENMLQKCKESYHLQLTLAKRLTGLANIASDPALTIGNEIQTLDAESVSYRLWVRWYRLL